MIAYISDLVAAIRLKTELRIHSTISWSKLSGGDRTKHWDYPTLFEKCARG